MVVRLVQKASGDWSSPLLSLEEYLALGKKRAPLFPYDRREIHAIAEFYQERLARSGRWDEIDLSRAALRRMDGRAEEFSWDLVVCDEVQDLTDVQLSLLFRLASNPRLVILTGDPRQIVNPSGFRWEEVKNKFFERGIPAPPVRRLSLNFRSAGSLVQLSNALLDIKADLVGLTDTEMREQWKFAGRPPLVLEGLAEEAILRSIDLRGAGQAVLVRTPAERDRLKAALATERVFTITEAKGLEFDAVFLWRFCGDAQAEELWSSIAAGQRPDPPRTPHLRHEIALLYVAVTRARNTLVAWDGEKASAVWDTAGVAPLVFRSSEPGSFSERWHSVSSPAEWDAQGEYYLARRQYAAARECFRNAGNDTRLALADAHVRANSGDDAGAAVLFEKAGEKRQAAECRERAADWAGARRLWRLLGQTERERVCAARMHEAAGSFSKAAREWEAAGEKRQAVIAGRRRAHGRRPPAGARKSESISVLRCFSRRPGCRERQPNAWKKRAAPRLPRTCMSARASWFTPPGCTRRPARRRSCSPACARWATTLQRANAWKHGGMPAAPALPMPAWPRARLPTGSGCLRACRRRRTTRARARQG